MSCSSVGVRCYRCGYDLAAHELGDACPECGRIIDGKRHWRRRLALWMVAALVVPAAVAFVDWLLILLAQVGAMVSGATPPEVSDLLVFGIPAVALIMTMAVLARWRLIRWTVLWSLIISAILGMAGIAGLVGSVWWLVRDFD